MISLFIQFGILTILAASLWGEEPVGVLLESTLNAEQLAGVLKQAENWNRVKKIRIEYECLTKGAPYHKIYAFAAPNYHYSLSSHFPKGSYPWQSDPYAQEYFINQGKTCHRWPFNRLYEEGKLNPGDVVPGSFPHNPLLPIIPVWFLTDYQAPIVPDEGAILPFLVALSSGKYRLLPGRESVGGEECVIWERKGFDRIWLAPDKVCIMRRDIYNKDYNKPRRRFLTKKIDQVAPGLWLPTHYEQQFLSLVHGTNDQEPINLNMEVRIDHCWLNDQVPESTFVATHLPGSVRQDANHQITQTRPGGYDVLSNIVCLAVQHLHLPSKRSASWHSLGWLGAGLGCGLCFGAIFLPTRKPSAKAP